MTIYKIFNKQLKLSMLIVHGRRLCSENLKGQCLYPYYSGDLFLIIDETEFASYMQMTKPYMMQETLLKMVPCHYRNLSKYLFKWLSNNEMQGNSGKGHLILSTVEPAEIQVEESLIKSNNCEKLLCIRIDSQLAFDKLTFDKHIKTVCKKSK